MKPFHFPAFTPSVICYLFSGFSKIHFYVSSQIERNLFHFKISQTFLEMSYFLFSFTSNTYFEYFWTKKSVFFKATVFLKIMLIYLLYYGTCFNKNTVNHFWSKLYISDLCTLWFISESNELWGFGTSAFICRLTFVIFQSFFYPLSSNLRIK